MATKIPQIGLGVWKAARGSTSHDAVAAALQLGYRHVDTAQAYGNEPEVGESIRASGLKREEVFVTTKLWNDDQGYDSARRAFDASLARLGCNLPPSVNQIEVHPFHQQRDTRAFCEVRGITVEAYSPLTHGTLIDHAVVTSVARTVQRSNAQVLLRWGIQHGMVVLPKSVSAVRIAENADVFDFALEPREMRLLDDLERGHATGWDPREQA